METGAWYQHRGRDFKVSLIDYLHGDRNTVGSKRGFEIWPGCINYSVMHLISVKAVLMFLVLMHLYVVVYSGLLPQMK